MLPILFIHFTKFKMKYYMKVFLGKKGEKDKNEKMFNSMVNLKNKKWLWNLSSRLEVSFLPSKT